MGSFNVNHVHLGGRNEYAIPSIIAVNKEDSSIKIGTDAVEANQDNNDLLIDWKILVGQPSEKINTEIAKNQSLSRALSNYGNSFQELLNQYIAYILKSVDALSLEEKPQMIVGIPVTTDFEQSSWRSRYKEQVSKAFKVNGYPEPKYFPEPFATFQYHWNRGDIQDSGEYQNIFVLDVGGGTTNVCMIQTTKHGILARGGGNKIPHGVNSVMIGGATLDDLIYAELKERFQGQEYAQAILKIRKAKEKISNKLKTLPIDCLGDDLDFEEVIEINNESVVLTYSDIKNVFINRFWPSVREAVKKSLSKIKSKKLRNPLDVIHMVILAGGTCQLRLVEYMFNKDISSSDPIFNKTNYLVSDAYNRAVSDGLAIEALANCQHHDIKPTRTSVYLNEDIVFKASHDRHRVSVPDKLKLKEGECDTDLRRGVILSAPQSISGLIGKKLRWDFKLKQKSHDVYYQFQKIDPGNNDVVDELSLGVKHIRIGKKSEEVVPKCSLRSVIDEDGFLKSFIDIYNTSFKSTPVSQQIEPVDLHDLNGVIGSSFIGLDLGTNSTLCSYINAEESLLYEVMPSKYWSKPVVIERSYKLISNYEDVAKDIKRSKEEIIRLFNQAMIKDYVYHSNRIEGSELNRGQTRQILDGVELDYSSDISSLRDKVERFSYIDDEGNVISAARPIKDGLAALNLRDAFVFVEDIAFDDRPFTKSDLLQIHQLVMRGEKDYAPGEFRNDNVKISQTTYVPPDFTQVSNLIDEMFVRFSGEDFGNQNPLVQATEAHVWFVSIHPFSDGNGRVARLLANYFLWRSWCVGVNLISENRERYYDALEWCNTREVSTRGDISDLAAIFCDSFEDSIEEVKLIGCQKEALIDESIENQFDESVPEDAESNFDSLLKRLSLNATKFSAENSYGAWKNYFTMVLSEINNKVFQLDSALKNDFSGGAKLYEYPIIDKDTYIAICRHERFSRTWYFKLIVRYGDVREELIFYFGAVSKQSKSIDSRFKDNCSLLISKYDPYKSQHVRTIESGWGSIFEIIHDGERSYILQENDDAELIIDKERVDVDLWFTKIIENLLSPALAKS